MDTYGRILENVYDRLTGQHRETTTPVTDDTVRTILDNSDDVSVTHLRASILPATTQRLTGDEPRSGWDELADTYELRDPELTARDTGTALDYAIRVDYYTDELYGGQWVFRDIGEDAVWTALNDV